MPRGLRRFLQFLLTIATTVVAILLFLLGHGKGNDLGSPCGDEQKCRPELVCGAPMGVPYCTVPCDVSGNTCPSGFKCEQFSPVLPNDGVCKKK
jgi:hypothetical protein